MASMKELQKQRSIENDQRINHLEELLTQKTDLLSSKDQEILALRKQVEKLENELAEIKNKRPSNVSNIEKTTHMTSNPEGKNSNFKVNQSFDSENEMHDEFEMKNIHRMSVVSLGDINFEQEITLKEDNGHSKIANELNNLEKKYETLLNTFERVQKNL